MDKKTADYYNENADDIFSRYESVSGGISDYFQESFPKPAKILDIGCGSGRDLITLLNMGHDAYGIEPSDNLRSLAIENHPELRGRITSGSLPDPGTPYDGNFEGIVCSAVLMHLPKEQIFDTAYSINRLLKHKGRVLISIPLQRHGLDESRRDEKGRLFSDLSADHLELIFARIGFTPIQRWENIDSLGREGFSWVTILLEKSTKNILRPLDKIESVLNRDKKDATYKFALLRALAELAMTSFHKAQWLENGKVAISVDDIVEKWIYYYWPILESETFIPQKNGEKSDCGRPIAFRKSLSELITSYKNTGSLNAFNLELRNKGLIKDKLALFNNAKKSIRNTIIKGPVTYSGGSLPSGRLFEYDKKLKCILLDTDIWKEFSLMSHWIVDALILRWSEFTSTLSKKEIQPSTVIDLLLTVPDPERDVKGAKDIYKKEKTLYCVWTNSALKEYDIDHVIPYSLWKNNDLWNLMPSRRDINNRKRDKIPTSALIRRQKDSIIYYWQLLKSKSENRFIYETEKLCGTSIFKKINWENELFYVFLDSIEATANQRGCERWEP